MLFVVELRLSQRDRDAFGGEPAGGHVEYALCAQFSISKMR